MASGEMAFCSECGLYVEPDSALELHRESGDCQKAQADAALNRTRRFSGGEVEITYELQPKPLARHVMRYYGLFIHLTCVMCNDKR